MSFDKMWVLSFTNTDRWRFLSGFFYDEEMRNQGFVARLDQDFELDWCDMTVLTSLAPAAASPLVTPVEVRADDAQVEVWESEAVVEELELLWESAATSCFY